MKISRDEARILAAITDWHMGEAWANARTKEEASAWAKAVAALQKKLEAEGQDQRRLGRKSRDDWRDLMVRLAKKYKIIS